MYLLVNFNGSLYWRMKYLILCREKFRSISVYPYVPLAVARQKRDEAKYKLSLNHFEKKRSYKIANYNLLNPIKTSTL